MIYLRLPLLRSHAASSSYFLYVARISIHLPREAVEAAAVDTVHALAQTAVISVAQGPHITGLRAGGGLLVGAGHLFIPFLYLYITIDFVTNQVIVLLQFCYKIAGRPAQTRIIIRV